MYVSTLTIRTQVTSVALMRGLLGTTVVPRRPYIRLRNGLRRIESNSIATNVKSSEYLSQRMSPNLRLL